MTFCKMRKRVIIGYSNFERRQQLVLQNKIFIIMLIDIDNK